MKQLTKIIAVALCIVLFTACNGKAVDLKSNANSSSETSITENDNQEIMKPSVNENTPSQKEFNSIDLAKQANPDIIAWLSIPGTEIDHPVMQTSNNEDYLRRNENGEYDIWGSYFADYYSVLTNKSSLLQNTVIYGHSESTENPNGKRFTQLFRYLDIDFLKENPNIYLTVGNDRVTFQVFAIFFTDTDFYYIDPKPSDQGFENFAKAIANKNEYVFEGNAITPQDRLLTLSACAYRYDTEKTGNHRFVVMGKLIPEIKEIEFYEAHYNSNPQRP